MILSLFGAKLHLTYSFQVDNVAYLEQKKINETQKSLIIHSLIMQVKNMGISQTAIYELKLINANNRME